MAGPPMWTPTLMPDMGQYDSPVAVAGVQMPGSPILYAAAAPSQASQLPIQMHPQHYFIPQSYEHHGISAGGGQSPLIQSLPVSPALMPGSYDPTQMDMSGYSAAQMYGVPQYYSENEWFPAGQEVPMYDSFYNWNAGLVYEPATNNRALSANAVPYSAVGPSPETSLLMPATEIPEMQLGGSTTREAVPEMTFADDVICTKTENKKHVAAALWSVPVTRLGVQRTNYSLKKYRAKMDKLLHVTESKDRMLGALCVRRNQLLSDVVRATQMVTASRQRLESQRKANKALVKHIDSLATLDRDDPGGDTATAPTTTTTTTPRWPAPLLGVSFASNRNNSSREMHLSLSSAGSSPTQEGVKPESVAYIPDESSDVVDLGLGLEDHTFSEVHDTSCSLENGLGYGCEIRSDTNEGVMSYFHNGLGCEDVNMSYYNHEGIDGTFRGNANTLGDEEQSFAYNYEGFCPFGTTPSCEDMSMLDKHGGSWATANHLGCDSNEGVSCVHDGKSDLAVNSFQCENALVSYGHEGSPADNPGRENEIVSYSHDGSFIANSHVVGEYGLASYSHNGGSADRCPEDGSGGIGGMYLWCDAMWPWRDPESCGYQEGSSSDSRPGWA